MIRIVGGYMVDKRPELSTEKALATVQSRANPRQQSTYRQRAADGYRNVQPVQRLILDHVDEYQVLT